MPEGLANDRSTFELMLFQIVSLIWLRLLT